MPSSAQDFTMQTRPNFSPNYDTKKTCLRCFPRNPKNSRKIRNTPLPRKFSKVFESCQNVWFVDAKSSKNYFTSPMRFAAKFWAEPSPAPNLANFLDPVREDVVFWVPKVGVSCETSSNKSNKNITRERRFGPNWRLLQWKQRFWNSSPDPADPADRPETAPPTSGQTLLLHAPGAKMTVI